MAAFKDNVVLLVGASRGIGEQTAYQLAGQGAKLTLAARSGDALKRVAQHCRKLGGEALVAAVDVTQQKACRRLVLKTEADFGRIDTLLYNAGGGSTQPFGTKSSLQNAYEEMRLNYFGLLYCTYYALPALKKSGGRLVGVSSMGALLGLPSTATYNSAKHAMRGFLNSLRVELRGTGVTVTSIYLSAVRTQAFLSQMGQAGARIPSISPEQAAQRIIRAAASRRREIISSLEGKVAAKLYFLFPRLADRVLASMGSIYRKSDRQP